MREIKIKKENYDKFPKDFDDYYEKIKNLKHPLKESEEMESIEFSENILDIYKYPSINITPKNNDHIITIIFFGATGAGKSTLINHMSIFY